MHDFNLWTGRFSCWPGKEQFNRCACHSGTVQDVPGNSVAVGILSLKSRKVKFKLKNIKSDEEDDFQGEKSEFATEL